MQFIGICNSSIPNYYINVLNYNLLLLKFLSFCCIPKKKLLTKNYKYLKLLRSNFIIFKYLITFHPTSLKLIWLFHVLALSLHKLYWLLPYFLFCVLLQGTVYWQKISLNNPQIDTH